MARWSRQPGVRVGWHAAASIEARAAQPNPNLVTSECGWRFPETRTEESVPAGEEWAVCRKCLSKLGSSGP